MAGEKQDGTHQPGAFPVMEGWVEVVLVGIREGKAAVEIYITDHTGTKRQLQATREMRVQDRARIGPVGVRVTAHRRLNIPRPR